MNPPSIQFHDPKCKLCRPALLAIRRSQRSNLKVRVGFVPRPIRLTLVPDFNAFGRFMGGYHISLLP